VEVDYPCIISSQSALVILSGIVLNLALHKFQSSEHNLALHNSLSINAGT
jgi:hypothetical protein